MKTESITRITWAALVVLVMCGYSFAEQTIYVDDDGPADFNNIQAAIDDSNDGDTIIVADGTYTGAGNREISFRGKAITVRSENGPGNCIIDCQGKGIGFLYRDGEDANSILDGLTITNGYGALYINRYSSPMIINCKFENNHAGGYGGAIHCHSYYSPKLTNCIFTGNSSLRSGGGIYIAEGSPILTNCRFSGNSAVDWGGAVHCEETSSPTIRNCLIIGNKTEDDGGGISIMDGSSAIIENCMIRDNIANDEGWGIYCDHIATVSYSDVQGGWPGEGNIDADPLFVDPGYWDNNGLWVEGDYHLLPYSPCIDAGDPDYVPDPNDTDLDGRPRVINGRIDMGAYEASLTYHVDGVNGNNTNDGLTPETAFATIQRGINVAEDYDTVLVWPGVYKEEIGFWGDAITVKSAADAAVVETKNGYAFSFFSAEGPDTVLSNFVIRDSQFGIYLINGASPSLRNLTIVNNDFGISAFNGADPDISNCIFWDNIDGDLFREPVPLQARYSCIEEGGEGEGNISIEPGFVDANNGDYHLLSERGRYWPAHDVWVLDDLTSPCVDSGDPNVDPSNEPMPSGGRINMGAYGNTAYASMSEWPIRGDINNDGRFNFMDIAILLDEWLQELPWAQ